VEVTIANERRVPIKMDKLVVREAPIYSLHTILRPMCPQPALPLNGISPASPVKCQNGLRAH
jgi:hypothetical protein